MSYRWNLREKFIESGALENSEAIIHLAGANVAKYWTAAYKKEITSSRVQSLQLLYEQLEKKTHRVEALISSSAIGYYGEGGDQWLTEISPAGNDFLAGVCRQWEQAAWRFEELHKRVAIIRTGIVLAKEGGSLPELLRPMRFGLAPVFGSGKQFYSWIHVDDLCRLFVFLLRNQNTGGLYNGVAPHPVRFTELMKAIRSVGKKTALPLPVPALVLRLALGGFGQSLLTSQRVSSEKANKADFRFRYNDLPAALEELMGKKKNSTPGD